MEHLPEDCFSYVLSLTSPIDAGRISAVSSVIKSAADSDKVWEKFLPSDYYQIITRLVSPPPCCSSMKDLFLRLCNPQLIDGGKKMFKLEKSSKKLYILSARELTITWANNPLYWTWKSDLLHSRFGEVAELRTICWLEIYGNIKIKMLSPRTHYTAYLIVKFANRAFGLDTLPSQVSVEVGNKIKSRSTVYLRCSRQESTKRVLETIMFLNRVSALRSRVVGAGGDGGGRGVVREREDGWVEIELGRFFNGGGEEEEEEEEVKMCLKEVTGEHLKGGLIVEGIELRPN
ncbi:F-box protein PP2-B15-like [Carica papaya]|uniref:F-box protein PP2-B15-like n=1 Tax=Carica papaya TaxID=3649 RepID=UPI000B8CB649|nr:F-box protein PP2-B15-like [Carica papaya]